MTLPRLAKLLFYGVIMTAGTRGVLHYALQTMTQAQVLTLAFCSTLAFSQARRF
jgi:hypothetical protein